jgi:hypothetical protein
MHDSSDNDLSGRLLSLNMYETNARQHFELQGVLQLMHAKMDMRQRHV